MEELRKIIKNLATKGIFDKADAYLYSIEQKKWSLNQYKANLQNLSLKSFSQIINRTREDIVWSFTAQTGEQISDINDYRLKSNMNFDGFVFNAVSILDSLAHLIYTLYPISKKLEKIYFKKWFVNYLEKEHSQKTITGVLKKVVNEEDWHIKLNDYRDVTTHERVVETQIAITKSDINIFLPDDPKLTPLTYKEEEKLSLFTEDINTKINSLLETVFKAIEEDIKKFNQIPLPIENIQ